MNFARKSMYVYVKDCDFEFIIDQIRFQNPVGIFGEISLRNTPCVLANRKNDDLRTPCCRLDFCRRIRAPPLPPIVRA